MDVDGDIYSGEFNENGERHGFGKLVTTSGDVYEGQFKDGFICGHGTLIRVKAPDSDFAVKYKGEWKNNSQNGFGVLEVEGNVITGNFHNGLPHGNGLCTSEGLQRVNGARSASWIRCLAFT